MPLDRITVKTLSDIATRSQSPSSLRMAEAVLKPQRRPLVCGDLPRARRMIETVLAYVTDRGFFAEEADPQSGAMLGNFPQTFAHASFIGAAIDYRQALLDAADDESAAD